MFSVEFIKGVSPKNIEKFSGDTVTFGRGDEVDYEFSANETTVSRGVHFVIEKNTESEDLKYTVLNKKDNSLYVQCSDRKNHEIGRGNSCEIDSETSIQIGEDGPILRVLLEHGNDKTVSVRAAAHRVTSIDEKDIRAAENSRKVWIPAAVAIAVLTMVGLWINSMQDVVQGEKIDKQTSALASQSEDIVSLSEKAQSLELTLQDAIKGSTETSNQLTRVIKKVDDIADNAVSLNFVDRYGSSIFALGLRSPDGKFTLVGTGWQIGSHSIMTNAHVVEGMFGLLEQYQGFKPVAILPVQTSGSSGEQYDLDSQSKQIHIGYKTYGEFSFPVITLIEDQIGKFDMIPWHVSNDCAILTSLKELPGEPIEIASTEEVRKLKIGEPISTLGFPGMAAGSTNNPSLITDHGVIASLEDAFGMTADRKYQTKMGITTNVTGGASGSPIFNKHGQAIGIVTSTLSSTQGRYQYGERADFMNDLVKKDYENAYSDWERYIWKRRNQKQEAEELAKLVIAEIAKDDANATFTSECLQGVGEYVYNDIVTINKSDPDRIEIFRNLELDGYAAVAVIPEEGFDIDMELVSIRRELRRSDNTIDKAAFKKLSFKYAVHLENVKKQQSIPHVSGFIAPDNELIVENPWKNMRTFWVTDEQEQSESTTLRVVVFEFTRLKGGCYFNE